MELLINSMIDVLWEDNVYKATIQDIQENEVLTTIPVKDGTYLTLKDQSEIEQIFYDGKGNIFNYKVKIIGRYVEKDISFYRVTKPYNIRKVQRRDDVRVKVVQIINYIKESDFEKEIETEDNYENALLLDLSGGGMKIKAKEKFANNDVIIATLKYEDEKIYIKGNIIRIEKTDDRRYIYGVNFIDMDNSTREKIIRIVFKIMRKQRELV